MVNFGRAARCNCDYGILVALLLPAIQAARESARRTQYLNHLKQWVTAMHLYHDAKGQLPIGSRCACCRFVQAEDAENAKQ